MSHLLLALVLYLMAYRIFKKAEEEKKQSLHSPLNEDEELVDGETSLRLMQPVRIKSR